MSLPLISSGPLSALITAGLPRQAIIWSKLRITRSAGNEKPTSIPKASRLKSSITLNKRIDLPSSSWSCIKSIDQTWLMVSGTTKASGLSRTKRLRGLIRRLSSNSLSPKGLPLVVNTVDPFAVPFEVLLPWDCLRSRCADIGSKDQSPSYGCYRLSG